jgi:hypothetical protein
MVNEGLGNYTENYMVTALLQSDYLSIPDDINANFLPNNPVSGDAANTIYYVGTNAEAPLFNLLVNNTNTTSAKNQRLWLEQSLYSYTNMTTDQIAEFSENWNHYWWISYENLTNYYIPSNSTYQNQLGLAYW